MSALAAAAWPAVRRVLCVRLDASPDPVGDVLMCTPAMRALRGAPASMRRLSLLTTPAGAALAPFVPEIDDVIAQAAPSLTDPAVVAEVAARAFDAAVIFTSYTGDARPAAQLCQLAGIPLRLAYCHHDPHYLSAGIVDPEPGSLIRHDVQRQLDLVKRIGCLPRGLGLSFAPRAQDLAAVRARLRESGVDPGRPWLLLHPGAAAPAWRYPPGHWASVVAQLGEALDLPLVLVLAGSLADAPLVASIRRACGGVPTHALAGGLTLGELGAALQLAAVAVTSHGAPAHIAAAVGTPLVDLYALTHPQHTPWKVRSRVLFQDVPCRFCLAGSCPESHHGCLAGVAPDRVAAAVRDLLPERTASDRETLSARPP